MSGVPPDGAAQPEERVVSELGAGRYDSFVIRVFTRGEHGRLVDGQVMHVGTRVSARFTSFEHAITFMQAHLSGARASGPGKRTSP